MKYYKVNFRTSNEAMFVIKLVSDDDFTKYYHDGTIMNCYYGFKKEEATGFQGVFKLPIEISRSSFYRYKAKFLN